MSVRSVEAGGALLRGRARCHSAAATFSSTSRSAPARHTSGRLELRVASCTQTLVDAGVPNSTPRGAILTCPRPSTGPTLACGRSRPRSERMSAGGKRIDDEAIPARCNRRRLSRMADGVRGRRSTAAACSTTGKARRPDSHNTGRAHADAAGNAATAINTATTDAAADRGGSGGRQRLRVDLQAISVAHDASFATRPS